MSTNRVPVFRLFQPTWGEPAYYVLRDVAIRMVRDRAATCINRGIGDSAHVSPSREFAR